MIERSTGITIKREITVANILTMLFLLIQGCTLLYTNATDHQETKDDIRELKNYARESKEYTKSEALRLAEEMRKNIARRDESDRVIYSSLQAINNRMDAMTEALLDRRHSELTPSPSILPGAERTRAALSPKP